ncbi:MAG: sugar ABC transporter ATP-binding protein, partial [Ruthenibacterium sp.]
IGRYPMKKLLGFIPIIDHEQMYKNTQALLEKVHMNFDPRQKLGTLSVSQMQSVEIAKAVSADCKVLILDEPTSSLTANEVEALFRIVDDLKKQNVSIVYISHKMDEILRIADEVTIMRDGQYVGTWDAKNLTTDTIITKMVGRELTNLYPPRTNVPGEVIFEVKDYTSINPRSFRDVNFTLRKGEILGVGGLVGAQRTELMEGLFGLRCHTEGTVTYKGESINIARPQDAIKKSIALLTEDRRATGILGVLSVADNVAIASLDQYLEMGIMLNDKKIEKLVQDNVAKLSIKTPNSKTQIQSLSGGNQQKVLISRWLANNPDVLILDEPTRGIDVGAKYEIYCIIADLAKQGKSIIMISSEMGELIGMSDRIMVMCDGRVTGIVDGKDATQENIMALATQFE